jgi:hypothetical protein
VFLRNSFSGTSFSPVSFSLVSFGGAVVPPEDSARSGYWRLFFIKMQEEALRQYEGKRGIKPQEKQPEVVSKKPAKPKKPAAVKPVAVSALPSKPKPMLVRPQQPQDIDYSQPILALSLEVQSLVLQSYPQLLQLRVREIKIQEAANDADNRRRLLLLLAA